MAKLNLHDVALEDILETKSGIGKNGKEWKCTTALFRDGIDKIPIEFWGTDADALSAFILETSFDIEAEVRTYQSHFDYKWHVVLKATRWNKNNATV